MILSVKYKNYEMLADTKGSEYAECYGVLFYVDGSLMMTQTWGTKPTKQALLKYMKSYDEAVNKK